MCLCVKIGSGHAKPICTDLGHDEVRNVRGNATLSSFSAFSSAGYVLPT